jgi:hypothetical protein
VTAAGALAIAQAGAITPSGRNFPTVGGKLANQRYSSQTGINK